MYLSYVRNDDKKRFSLLFHRMWKLILRTTVSVDGYIGTVTWGKERLVPFEADQLSYWFDAFYTSIWTIIVWRTAYQSLYTYGDPFPYSDKEIHVFTRNRQFDKDEHANYVTTHIPTFVRQLKQAATKDIWLIGWWKVNGLLMTYGLIDECQLFVVPSALWNGIQLFAWNIKRQAMQLMNTRSYETGVVELQYTFS